MAGSDRQRIESDIRQMRELLKSLEVREGDELLLDMAARYCADAEFQLKKGDLMSAFGCINYAHGLLDSLKFRK